MEKYTEEEAIRFLDGIKTVVNNDAPEALLNVMKQITGKKDIIMGAVLSTMVMSILDIMPYHPNQKEIGTILLSSIACVLRVPIAVLHMDADEYLEQTREMEAAAEQYAAEFKSKNHTLH
jgi:hypothetical protein